MDNEKKQNYKEAEQVSTHGFQPNYEIDDYEISFIDWHIFLERKWLIFLVTLVFVVVSVVVALLITPTYRAEVLLAPMEESGNSSALGQFGDLASMAGINTGESKSTEQSLAVLKSRSFLEDFFQEEKVLPVLFSDIWDEVSGQWILDVDQQPPSMWSAYKIFRKSILISSIDKKSGLVTISIDWKDPELAAEWANNLVVRLNKNLRTLAVTEAENSINYLQEQLQQTSVVDMHQMLYRLIESETKKIMLAKVREQYVFRVIDPAVVPEEKIKPKRTLIVILGFLSGFIFSIFLALFIAKRCKAAR